MQIYFVFPAENVFCFQVILKVVAPDHRLAKERWKDLGHERNMIGSDPGLERSMIIMIVGIVITGIHMEEEVWDKECWYCVYFVITS